MFRIYAFYELFYTNVIRSAQLTVVDEHYPYRMEYMRK